MKNLSGLPKLTIGSIFCIGRNYQKHARELGNSVPDEPMVFLKPASSLIGDGESIQLPAQSNEVHHEVELVIAIGKKGKNIPEQDARDYIAGYGLGIDVTARDIQQKAKDRRHPWSMAKGFDTFAPISTFMPIQPNTDFSSMDISLAVNGTIRQQGNTVNMIFPVTTLISYLSTIFTLNPGDLIFTGTPEGVSPIKSGDSICATLNNGEITLTILVK
ncbi:MAG: fumarylacetoacetate hydrolase family protein [Balneolaceae bacterium]|nr:fumarylacetoacetate hydrolase family protein [Balneolaceae bacterium]